ncbi:MAG TPA: lactate racemase domain-containing protein [Oligoflexia bacterium]|nr:lactate racemase domain-containing protein [Oligoflexia bacterium]
MTLASAENPNGGLSKEQLAEVIEKTAAQHTRFEKVLLIHPDYSRHDFTDAAVPLLYQALASRGLKQLDTLNAAGTHRPMTQVELEKKLGLSKKTHPLLGSMYNHEFDNPDALMHVVDIPASYVKEKTSGHLDKPLAVTVNKLLTQGYDAIFAISGTVPHEGTGYSGGTKILFPGISGPEVIGLFHWAAVLIGIPEIIGTLDNPAREVVNEGAKHIFALLPKTPLFSLNMVYTEDKSHNVVANGFYSGAGLEGFTAALRAAAALSSKLHIKYLDEPKQVVVQQIPEMYDEIWTAGKGSYKLQRPGVIAEGGEIILFAPHIHCFHSNAAMDADMRKIGYHGRDYVVDYCQRNPDFNKNVASHMINVRGLGKMANGAETFSFKVTIATQISEADCRAVGLGYRDPKSLREEDFTGPGKLWIHEGGQWLYSRR